MDVDLTRIADDLNAMAEEDQRVRAELATDGSLYDGYHPRMESVHRRNAARLEPIVDQVGWPGRSLVGDAPARAAWLILQHSISNPDLMRRGLGWLREAAARGDIPHVEVAMLEDRIRVFEGHPQRYGTQLDGDAHGRLVPYPIEDPDRVDERRAAVGLPPLAETIPQKQDALARQGPLPCPDDRTERQAQRDAWLRSVGWRS